MLLTVVDPRHRRHPEVGVVLAIERVAVSIYRVVEVRIIPIQEGEGVGSQRKGWRTFSTFYFLVIYYVPIACEGIISTAQKRKKMGHKQ